MSVALGVVRGLRRRLGGLKRRLFPSTWPVAKRVGAASGSPKAKRDATREALKSVYEKYVAKRDKLALVQKYYHAARTFFPIYRQGMLAEAAARKVDDLKADCYLSLLPTTLPTAFELGRLAGGKVFCDNVENIDVDKHSFAPKWSPVAIQMVNDAGRGAMARCEGLLTVSNAIAKTLAPFGRPTMVLKNFREYEEPIGNGALREQCGLSNGDILLFASGNVVVGFEHVVDAMARLPEHFHLACLVRLKPQGYEESMLSRIDELGLSGRIHFFPFVAYEKLSTTVADADIGLITSDISNPNGAVGLPNRCFDYLTGGLPVVAPAMPDVKDLVDLHGFGQILPITSAEEWEKRILIVAEDLTNYRARAIEARAKLTWESQEAELFEFLGRPKSVTMIGFRDLSRYQRHIRVARSLRKFGCTVKMAFFSEDPDTENMVEGVGYYCNSDRYIVDAGFVTLQEPAVA